LGVRIRHARVARPLYRAAFGVRAWTRVDITRFKEEQMHRMGWIMSVAALCACGDSAQITPPRSSSSAPMTMADRDRDSLLTYDLEKLPTLGGSSNRGNGINNRDWVAGYANMPDNKSRHAALWRNGTITDLETLGGANSTVAWPGINDRGMIVGISETADVDTLHEDWSCAAFFPSTGHVCLGFVWEDGHMRALPTFGGINGYATDVNDRGQIVGWAETRVHDPTCNAPQVLQFRAALWDARTLEMRELRPLHGDSTSAATAINNRGQAVGISGACDVAVGEFSAEHSVLWEHGRTIELPTLGGIAWNTPTDINDAGDVVGFSDRVGDVNADFNAHAFFWSRRGGIRDLGALPGDTTSQATSINARREVVGISCNDAACRAVIWLDGRIHNLNKMMGSSFVDSLVSAQAINDDGTITGRLIDKGTGLGVAFIARPHRRDR
jgi:probable HAF family extracellular repeat protein